MKMKVNMNMGMGVNVKPMIEKDGVIIKEYPLMHNLILDSGMTAFATRTGPECFEYASVGSGVTATYRTSGAVTVTSAGQTLTASAALFDIVNDIGRLIRFGTSGDVRYLTADGGNSDTQFKITEALTLTPGETAVIYNVEQTTLAAKVGASSNTYRVLNNNCGHGYQDYATTAPKWINWRTFEFPVETSQVTYTEAGWSWGSTADLTGRILFTEQGDTVTVEIGERLLLYVEFVVVYDSSTYDTDDLTPTGLPITGFNQDATYRFFMYSLSSGGGAPYVSYLPKVNLVNGTSENGQADSSVFMVPFTTGENVSYFLQCWLTDDDSIITSWALSSDDGIQGCSVDCTQTAVGSFYKDYEAYFAGTAADSLTGFWNDIRVGDQPYGRPGLRILFDNSDTYTKTDSNTLTLNFRKSWSRYFA